MWAEKPAEHFDKIKFHIQRDLMQITCFCWWLSFNLSPGGSFINFLSLEKFDFTKTAQVLKIQLKKHKTKYSVFPAMRFVIQMQSKHIRALQHWKNIMVSGLAV